MKTIKKISDQKGKHDLQTLTQKQMSMVFGGVCRVRNFKDGGWSENDGTGWASAE
jgi:hypothetical protein